MREIAKKTPRLRKSHRSRSFFLIANNKSDRRRLNLIAISVLHDAPAVLCRARMGEMSQIVIKLLLALLIRNYLLIDGVEGEVQY